MNFFAVDLKKRHKGFLGLLRLFSDLKKLGIDVVADLDNVIQLTHAMEPNGDIKRNSEKFLHKIPQNN